MGESYLSELSMINTLMNERGKWTEVLELLEEGNTEKAKEKIKRSIDAINEALELDHKLKI